MRESLIADCVFCEYFFFLCALNKYMPVHKTNHSQNTRSAIYIILSVVCPQLYACMCGEKEETVLAKQTICNQSFLCNVTLHQVLQNGMGWLCLGGSIKSYVSFAKDSTIFCKIVLYKREYYIKEKILLYKRDL